MAEIQLGTVEARFADIIWERAGDVDRAYEAGGGGAWLEADYHAHGAAAALR